MLQAVLRVTLTVAFAIAATPLQRAVASPAPAPAPAPASAPTDFPPPPVLEPTHALVHGQPTLSEPWKEGEILVQIKPNATIDRVMRTHKLPGVAKRYIDLADTPANRATGALRWFTVPVPKGQEGAIVVEIARNLADVAYVQLIPQHEPTVAGAPNDPCYTTQPSSCNQPTTKRQQPYMDFIKMPRAWDRTHATSSSPAIAFIDSGVQSSHPDVQGKLLAGWDYSNGVGGVSIPAGSGTDSGCLGGHGTGTATIAAAATNNNTGMAGTGWDAKIIPIKYLNNVGPSCSVYGGVTLATALYKARDLGAKVVNLSIMESRTYNAATQQAINNLTTVYGILIIAAAGNNNCQLSLSLGQYQYPCAYANVLCVGGSQTTSPTQWSTQPLTNCDLQNNPFWGTNYGGEFVYVSAPAVNVINGTANNSYGFSNGGTSYAAPLVSGIGALLMASGCRPLEARQAITDTAQANDGWTRYGPVNAAGALTRRCAPGTSAWANGNRIDIIQLGKDGKVHQMLWNNISGWVGWDPSGFPVSSPPAGAGSSPYILWSQFDGAGVGHRLDVWVEGFDLNLYQMTWCDAQGLYCPGGASWSSWFQVAGPPAASTPAIAGKRTNIAANVRQDLFVRPWNSSVFYEQPWTNVGYWGWKTAPGGPGASKSEPSAVWSGAADNLLDLVVLGDNGRLYHNFNIGSNPSSPTWSGWSDRGIPVGGLITSSPYLAGSPTATHLDALALAADGLVYQAYWTGSGSWTWRLVGSGQPAAGAGPSTTWRGGGVLEAFLLAANGNIYQSSFNGSTWSSWLYLFGAP